MLAYVYLFWNYLIKEDVTLTTGLGSWKQLHVLSLCTYFPYGFHYLFCFSYVLCFTMCEVLYLKSLNSLKDSVSQASQEPSTIYYKLNGHSISTPFLLLSFRRLHLKLLLLSYSIRDLLGDLCGT